jgi:pantetheine-phosphate adenylyltransferase
VSTREKRKRVAVYPGTFDPATNGHLDIARRAASIFDTLIIAVLDARPFQPKTSPQSYVLPAKNALFSADERVALWQEVIAAEALENVRVEKFSSLLVEFVRSVDGDVIIKGLRSPNDFEAEFRQALMNRKLAPEIETVCLLTNHDLMVVSSSLLKEVARLGGDVTDMLPAPIARALQHKFDLVK